MLRRRNFSELPSIAQIELLEGYRSRPIAGAIDTMLCGVWCSGANLNAAGRGKRKGDDPLIHLCEVGRPRGCRSFARYVSCQSSPALPIISMAVVANR